MAALRRPEVNPAGVVGPLFLRHTEVVTSAPGDRHEVRIVPARLDPRAVPGAAVVQDEDQSDAPGFPFWGSSNRKPAI